MSPKHRPLAFAQTLRVRITYAVMVEEGLSPHLGSPPSGVRRSGHACLISKHVGTAQTADSRPLALPYCLESVCDQGHGHTTRLAIEMLPSVMGAYRLLRGSPLDQL